MKNTIIILFLVISASLVGSQTESLLSKEAVADQVELKGNYAHSFDAGSTVTSLAFHPTGDLLAYGCDNGSIDVFDFKSSSTKKYLLGESITALQWSPDESLIATSFVDRNQNGLHVLKEGATEFETKDFKIPGKVHSLTSFASTDPSLLFAILKIKGISISPPAYRLACIDPHCSTLQSVDESEQMIALAVDNNSLLAAYSLGKTIQFLKYLKGANFEKAQKWTMVSGVKQLEFCSEDLLCVAIEKDIQLRQLTTGLTIYSIAHPDPIITLKAVQLEEPVVVVVTNKGRLGFLEWECQKQKECQLEQRTMCYACVDPAQKKLGITVGKKIHVSSLSELLRNAVDPGYDGSGSGERLDSFDSYSGDCCCIIL